MAKNLKPKVSSKQKIFIKEYLIDKNATRAAKAAGYSEKTARSQGQRLLTKVDIKALLDRGIDQQCMKLELKADHILRELLRIATADVGLAFDDMGQMKPLSEIPEDVRRAISSLEVHEIFDGQGEGKMAIGLARKVKFWDKPRALEMLGRHLKLFVDELKVTSEAIPVSVSISQVRTALMKIEEEF